jgi:hypothetical protein
MMTTLIPESIRVATESFSPVSAGMLALFAIQEIKLKRLGQKRRRMTATNQNIESDRGGGRGNAIDVGGGRENAASTMRHFDRAVERLRKLDGNRMCDNPIIDCVTHDLDSDIRGIWSARANVQGSKELPVLLHGNGSKGKLRRQRRHGCR